MSANYRISETTRRRRTNQASYGASNNRSTFGYWVPLVLTVTAATVGIAAWIWSERKEDEEESSSEGYYSSDMRPPPGYAGMSGGVGPGPRPGPGYTGPPPPEWQGGRSVGGAQQGEFSGPGGPGVSGEYQGSRSISNQQNTSVEETGIVARMSNALGMTRAPSPGGTYNWASGKVSAGMAAAGAMVGGAISSVTRGSQEEYEDHDRWNEEVERRESQQVVGQDSRQQSRQEISRDLDRRESQRDVTRTESQRDLELRGSAQDIERRESRQESSRGLKRSGTADEFYSGSVSMPRSTSFSSTKRKTVAIVVSSVQTNPGDSDVGAHASILAHLPEHVTAESTRIFVLIYAPDLQTHPLSPEATGRRPSQSMASSFSNISQGDVHTPAQTPGEFPGNDSDGILANVDPKPIDESTSTLYKTLHNQAHALVDRDTMIFPFSTPQGHKHIIKSIQPEIVYIQESLCGPEGEIVSELSGWVSHTVVVIGDEGGMGGLIDTDDELAVRGSRAGSKGSATAGSGRPWWQREERTGLGRGVSVVEALKIGEDWRRRVNGEE